jgi:2-methylisocitrate lyase-like PEP mutase family enzyme
MGNIIEGGLTENISAKDLASMGGFALVVYPFTMVAARVRAAEQALQALKQSFDVGAPPMIMSAAEVCKAVGFEEYWALEERYAY